MKVTLDETKSRTTCLTVESEASELEPYLKKVYERLSKRTEVPGFAKGKAPRDAIEKHVGREKVIKDTIEEWAHATYPKVLKEQKINAWLQPMVTVLQNEPPKFEIAVIQKPIVKLGDYRSMKVPLEPLEVKEEEIDEVLEKSQLQLADHHPVDRSVKDGDLVEIDIEGTLSGSSFIDKKYLRTRVTSRFAPDVPGLYKMIIGIKKGEETKFKLKFPKDNENKILAGKEADFNVKVHEVREVTLPELNDDFANKVAPGVGTLDKLKERIRFHMKKEKEQNAETKYKEKVVETLIENSQLEYSPLMIDIQAKALADDSQQQTGSSDKDDKESIRALAKKRVLWSLVLDEVAKEEGIVVGDDEITNEIDSMTQDIQEEMEQKAARRRLHAYERQNIEDVIKARKTINKLAEIVKNQSSQ